MPMTKHTPHRARILENATAVTVNARSALYGTPEDNLGLISRFWNLYLQGRQNPRAMLTASDVSRLMVLVKIARTLGPGHTEDNYVDAAAYAAIAGELAHLERREELEDLADAADLPSVS